MIDPGSFSSPSAESLPYEGRSQTAEDYRFLLGSLDEGFCIIEVIFDARGTATDYRFLETNPAFEKHTGLVNATGRTARELVPDLDEHWFRTYGEVARTGRSARFESPAPAMGRYFDVFALRVGDPAAGRVALFFTDITERKTDLDRLRRTEEELRTAIRAKDEFLGLISHELRTPLTVILGNADVLSRVSNIEDEMRVQALRDIVLEGGRLNRVIENMLQLARLDVGKELELEPVLLSRTIARVAGDFAKKMPETPLTIEGGDEYIIVHGNDEYVEQILQNLLSNAAKYSKRGQPITLRIEATGREACISVEDRGIGVRSAEDGLFQPFYRENEDGHHTSGLGIGLAVCKRLVEVQGGTIDARPREGGGSIFSFSLPLQSSVQGSAPGD